MGCFAVVWFFSDNWGNGGRLCKGSVSGSNALCRTERANAVSSVYHIRGWNGWHHHVTLVMMAMLFMLKRRLSNKDEYPIFRCSDIQTLLKHFLPKRDVTALGSAAPDEGQTQKTAIIHRFCEEETEEETKWL